jgi:hypothetical protein
MTQSANLLVSGIRSFRAEIAAIEGQDLKNFDALVDGRTSAWPEFCPAE